MEYTAVNEIKTETKVYKGIYLFDFFFIIIYMMITWMVKDFVSSNLQVLFIVFSAICALYLTSKSATNKNRRKYQAIVLFLKHDRAVYRPVMNISKATENQLRKEKDERENNQRLHRISGN